MPASPSTSEEEKTLDPRPEDNNEKNVDHSQDSPEDDNEYAAGTTLIFLAISLVAGMFLVAIDNTIISTAIPKITDEFKDLNKAGWYGSAYFMTFGAFQAAYGKLYKFYPIKVFYIIAMIIFMVGSVVCAVAKNPTTFIIGRAIQGLGGSGVVVGLFTIVGFSTRPAQRPQFLGLLGACYCISGVLGPLLGGVFTETVTWRWCFYINLPIGGVAILLTFFFFKPTKAAQPVAASTKEKFLQMDLPGIALMMGLLISYILALQYGGQTYAWKSSVVIGLLVGFVAMLAAFIAWELYQQEYAMIVPRIFKARYIWSGTLYMIGFSGAYFVCLFYIPIYFQSIDNTTPIFSGVRMLAMIVPLTIAAVSQGFAFLRIGRAPVFWVVGGALATVGCGLFYTMDSSTTMGKWIGYQIIVGFAVGATNQVALQAAQVQVSQADLSQATAIINFALTAGGALLLTAAQCAFNNRLVKYLAVNLPEINAAVALGTGATEIRSAFTPEQVPIVLDAYNYALKSVWIIAVAGFGWAFLVGFTGNWQKLDEESIKKAQAGIA